MNRPAALISVPRGPDAADRRGPPGETPEALFREARARRRKRWLLGAVFVAVALVAALLTMILTIGSTPPAQRPAVRPAASPGVPPNAAPLLAWVDYEGHLHIGNAETGTQSIVGQAKADPVIPLVALHGRLFWVGTGCAYEGISKCPYSDFGGVLPTQVKEFDPATKKTVSLGRGDALFAGPGGHSIDVVRKTLDCPASVHGACDPYAEQVVQIPLSRGGIRRTLTVPSGWYVNAGDGYANPMSVAGGILVQSALAQASSTPARFGIWDPASGKIRQLGRDWGLIDSHTARNGRSSLLAWLPGRCLAVESCDLRITDTGTGRTIDVPSPMPYGFDIGGAFSPDGTRLAVFVKTNDGGVNPAMQLAIVDTATGKLRLIPGVQGEIGESVGWARWLPDGTHVLAGTFSAQYRAYNHYLIDADTNTVKLVDFSSDQNTDVNFSASTVGGLSRRP